METKRINKEEIEISSDTIVSVVTSGYSDRFLTGNTIYTVKYKNNNGKYIKVSFSDRDQVIDFLVDALGLSGRDASIVTHDCKKSFYISGKVKINSSASLTISVDDVNTIDVYLKNLNLDTYTDDYKKVIARQLTDHPLSEKIKNVVDWQIAECDRRNFEYFGHKDGSFAAKQAGVEIPALTLTAAEAVQFAMRKPISDNQCLTEKEIDFLSEVVGNSTVYFCGHCPISDCFCGKHPEKSCENIWKKYLTEKNKEGNSNG